MTQQQLAYEIAKLEIGVKEIEGSKHNQRILEYHSTCILNATTDETPWCSAFINWCFLMSGMMINNKKMFPMLNYYSFTQRNAFLKSMDDLVLKIGDKTDESINPILPTRNAMARSWLAFGYNTQNPTEGDLVIFSRGSDNISGHVCFFIDGNTEVSKCLGGNQSNSVRVAFYQNNKILGFRTTT